MSKVTVVGTKLIPFDSRDRPAPNYMPLYEYHCELCGLNFEVLQKMDAAELTEHECGGRLNKVASVPSLQFKGTGWTQKTYK